MTASAFLRWVALGAVPRMRRRRIERRLLAQLARLGNNLNQLTRIANATGRLGAERRLRRLLDRIDQAVRSIAEP